MNRHAAESRKVSGRRDPEPTRLALYAGRQGWKNPEYIELLQSAREFLGEKSVLAVTAPRRFRLLHCILIALLKRPTHFLYDPRWGAQTRFLATVEGLGISVALRAINCVPISLLNNLPESVWRKKISRVSGKRGICLMLVAPSVGKVFAPEIENQVGPMPMALSQQTFAKMREGWLPTGRIDTSSGIIISFVGSLYEPRTSMLEFAERELASQGIELRIYGRTLDQPKIPVVEYFRLLAESAVVYTTADQAHTEDKTSFPIHLVYRYIEVLATGALLVAPAVPGAENYFVPGVHFVECPTTEALAKEVPVFLRNANEVRRVRESGRERVSELVREHFFWRRVDAELRHHNFSPLSGT